MFSGNLSLGYSTRLVIQLIIVAVMSITGPLLSFGRDSQAQSACPLLVAHDGYSGAARIPGDGPVPPDSVQALESAVQSGAQYVKFDVRWSADNVPVIIHNSTVNATTRWHGKVASYRSGALTRMRLVTRTGQLTGDRLPTAAALLRAAVAARVSGIILEVKPDAISPGQVRSLHAAVAAAGALRESSVQTFFPGEVGALAAAWPSASIALLERLRAYVPHGLGSRLRSVVLAGDLVTAAHAAMIRRAGLVLGAYTSTGAGVPDRADSWDTDLRDGVQQVFTDNTAGYLRWEAARHCRAASAA
jgi:glycerophosphoryl diester phosphodiesterase